VFHLAQQSIRMYAGCVSVLAIITCMAGYAFGGPAAMWLWEQVGVSNWDLQMRPIISSNKDLNHGAFRIHPLEGQTSLHCNDSDCEDYKQDYFEDAVLPDHDDNISEVTDPECREQTFRQYPVENRRFHCNDYSDYDYCEDDEQDSDSSEGAEEPQRDGHQHRALAHVLAGHSGEFRQYRESPGPLHCNDYSDYDYCEDSRQITSEDSRAQQRDEHQSRALSQMHAERSGTFRQHHRESPRPLDCNDYSDYDYCEGNRQKASEDSAVQEIEAPGRERIFDVKEAKFAGEGDNDVEDILSQATVQESQSQVS
jgi:hypothetical protein